MEGGGHDLPHREQSKIDAVVPQLQFDYGYMGDGGPLQIACFLVGADTSSGAIHATMVPDSKKVDMPSVVAATAKWVRDLGYERFCLHGDTGGVLQLLLDKGKECRPEGQDWQILRQVSPTQSHQRNGAAEKAVSTVSGLARTHLAVLNDQIPSFEVTTHSPILTRYNVRRDTRRTKRFVDRNTEKEILPLGERLLARRPGADVNQLLQPWVTGLWLGRDTLSDGHLIGTAAGVMRSRAVRRLQEPARWVPAAMHAMLFTPWSPRLNLPGRSRLQRPACEEPIEAGTLPRFIEIPTAPTKNPKSETLISTPGDAEQSTKRRRQEVTFQEPQPTSSSSGAVADTSVQIPDPQLPKPARPLSPAEREDSWFGGGRLVG